MYQVMNPDGTWPSDNNLPTITTASGNFSTGWEYYPILWPPKKLNVCERFILRCAQWTIRRLTST